MPVSTDLHELIPDVVQFQCVCVGIHIPLLVYDGWSEMVPNDLAVIFINYLQRGTGLYCSVHFGSKRPKENVTEELVCYHFGQGIENPRMLRVKHKNKM